MMSTLKDMCRTCLKHEGSKISVFDVAEDETSIKLSDMLYAIASIHVSESDKLPLKVCNDCVTHITDCYKFKNVCLDSEQKLLNLLPQELMIDEQNLEQIELETNDASQDIENVHTDENSDSIELLYSDTCQIEDTTISNLKRFCCPFCTKAFKKKLAFFQHLNTHKSNRAPQDTDEIKQHSDRELSPILATEEEKSPANIDEIPKEDIKKENYVKCVKCGAEFDVIADFWDHVATEHPDNTIIQSEQYKNGERTEKVSYYCRSCNIVFLQQANFSRHMKNHTSQRNCLECDAILQSEYALMNHMKKCHKKITSYKCPVCEQVFDRRYELIAHRNASHKKDPHLCPTCGKSFTDKGNLTAHMRIHSGEKPYVCKVCNKAFTQWAALNLHKAMHSDVRNFVCTTCGSKYKRRSALLSHMRKHSNEWKFSCAVCDKRFYSKTNLKDHAAKHTGEKNHECTTCGKCFSRKKTLIVHNRTHTGERPHVCNICGRAFIQRVVLRSHMKTHQELVLTHNL